VSSSKVVRRGIPGVGLDDRKHIGLGIDHAAFGIQHMLLQGFRDRRCWRITHLRVGPVALTRESTSYDHALDEILQNNSDNHRSRSKVLERFLEIGKNNVYVKTMNFVYHRRPSSNIWYSRWIVPQQFALQEWKSLLNEHPPKICRRIQRHAAVCNAKKAFRVAPPRLSERIVGIEPVVSMLRLHLRRGAGLYRAITAIMFNYGFTQHLDHLGIGPYRFAA
jgi:hypothetical protein